jgi:hypothetical protein
MVTLIALIMREALRARVKYNRINRRPAFYHSLAVIRWQSSVKTRNARLLFTAPRCHELRQKDSKHRQYQQNGTEINTQGPAHRTPSTNESSAPRVAKLYRFCSSDMTGESMDLNPMSNM